MVKIQEKRLIPLSNEFLNNKLLYDRIFVYLQLNSYLGKDLQGIKHRFVYATEIENTKLFYEKCNIQVFKNKEKNNFKNFCCYNTFVKSFNLLFEPTEKYPNAIGYLKKGKIIDLHQRLVDVYYIKDDIVPNKLIPIEVLQYLMEIQSNNVIKIYTYLLNKYTYKQSISKEKYTFTLQELSNAIGYTSKSINWNIEYILQELKQCELIKYHKQKVKTNKNTGTYKYFLDYVTTNLQSKENNNLSYVDNEGNFKF